MFAFCVEAITYLELYNLHDHTFKVKDSKCDKLLIKLWFEGGWYYFVILLSQDSFESDCPETKFQAITS